MIGKRHIGKDITPSLNRDLILCAGPLQSWSACGTGLQIVCQAGRPMGGFRASGTDDLAVFSEQAAASDILPTGETLQLSFSFPCRGLLRITAGQPSGCRFAHPYEDAPEFSCYDDSVAIHLDAAGYRLSVDKSSGLFHLTGPDGSTIVSQTAVKSIYWGYQAPPLGRLSREGKLSTVLSLARTAGESYYGFGEQYTDLDKRNQVVDIWNIDPANTLSAGSYLSIPFFLSTQGYGLLLDSARRSRFDMGSRTMAGIQIEIDDTAMDLYILTGSMKAALAQYYALTGRPSLTPPWSFGIWMSSLPAYTSSQGLVEAAEAFRSRGFPCDVLHVDPVWMGQRTLVCDFNWGPAFQDHVRMQARLHELGFKLSLWVAPYVPVGSALYDEGLSGDYFIKDDAGAVLVNEGAMNFWSVPFSYIDFTRPAAVVWYQAQIRRLLQDGADIIKNDLGELAPLEAAYADGTDGAEGHNRYCQLYAGATYDACLAERGDDAMIWSRSGYIGAARTPCHWAGDVQADFEHMRGQLRAVLSAGMSGFVFFSHDTGGFTGHPTPELYARWFQMGCFSSHLRAHGCFPHEPWHYGDRVYQICLAYANLRYSLLPTIYSAAARCCQEGRPLASPLVLDYQTDPLVRQIDDQFLFAGVFMVCPVFDGDTHRHVYLPEGGWFDYATGQYIHGGCSMVVETPLEHMPVYVRDGSVILTCQPRESVSAGHADWGPLTASVYTSRRSGRFEQPLYLSSGQQRLVVVDVTDGSCQCQDDDIRPVLASSRVHEDNHHGS